MSKNRTRQLILTTIMLACAVLFALPISGSKSSSKRVFVVLTGQLGELFHPLTLEKDASERNIRFLEEALAKLKKKHPDALFVDAGNYLDVPDYGETVYRTPALTLFRRFKYTAVNMGASEILVGEKSHLFHRKREKDEPHYVTMIEESGSGRNLGEIFSDASIRNSSVLRFMGVTRLDHTLSARPLKSRLREPERGTVLKAAMDSLPVPDVNLLLSDLSREENLALAGKVSGLDFILDAKAYPGDEVTKVKDAFICHRQKPQSVGLLSFRIREKGGIDKVAFKTLSLEKRGGLFSLFRKKPLPSPEPPLPVIGKLVDKELFFDIVTDSCDKYETGRLNARKYSNLLKDAQVYYYDLYEGEELTGRAFYVDHFLGRQRTHYMFFTFLTPDNRISRVKFHIIPHIAGWKIEEIDFFKPYIGKKWDEMVFIPEGCEGALTEYRILYEDMNLVSRIADTLIPE